MKRVVGPTGVACSVPCCLAAEYVFMSLMGLSQRFCEAVFVRVIVRRRTHPGYGASRRVYGLCKHPQSNLHMVGWQNAYRTLSWFPCRSSEQPAGDTGVMMRRRGAVGTSVVEESLKHLLLGCLHGDARGQIERFCNQKQQSWRKTPGDLAGSRSLSKRVISVSVCLCVCLSVGGAGRSTERVIGWNVKPRLRDPGEAGLNGSIQLSWF